MPDIQAGRELKAAHFSPDIVEFLRALAAHDVRYLVVGGEAVIFYGHARLTGDVDFFYDDSEANAARLFDALVDFWGGAVPEVEEANELQAPGLVLQFGAPPNRIDLMNRVSGVSFISAWENRLHIELSTEDGERIPLFLIGKAELLANKKASGRPKDLDDLAYLSEDDGVPPGQSQERE